MNVKTGALEIPLILDEIFNYLSPQDIKAVAQVNRYSQFSNYFLN